MAANTFGGGSHAEDNKPGNKPDIRPVRRNTSFQGTATAEVAVEEPVSGLVTYTFFITPSATQADVNMTRPSSLATVIKMPFRGSVIAMALASTGTLSAGTFKALIQKNGTNLPDCRIDWTSGAATTVVQFLKGTYGFERNDLIELVYTTNSTYVGAAVEVVVYAALDQAEA